MNYRPDHETTGNHQVKGALEGSVEVQPISGADLRRGRYVRCDGHGDIIPLYRWASGQEVLTAIMNPQLLMRLGHAVSRGHSRGALQQNLLVFSQRCS